jgi:hypothetical protein
MCSAMDVPHRRLGAGRLLRHTRAWEGKNVITSMDSQPQPSGRRTRSSRQDLREQRTGGLCLFGLVVVMFSAC